MLRRRGFLAGTLFSLTVFLLVMLFVPMRYEANDDGAILNAVRGDRVFQADATSSFMSQSMTDLLLFLYRLNPHFPWYSIIIYAAVLAGAALISGAVVRNGRDRYSLLLIFPALLVFCVCLFSAITFTSAALFLEFGVLLSLLDWLIADVPPVKHGWAYGIFITLCLFLAYLLRWQLVLFFLAFATPVAVYAKPAQLKKLLPFLALFLLLVSGDQLLLHSSDSPQRRAFQHYSVLRSEFNDTFKGSYYGERTDRAIKLAGWTTADYLFFRHWVLYDNTLFNVSTLEKFLNANTSEVSLADWTNILLKDTRKHLLPVRHLIAIFFFTCMAILAMRYDSIKYLPRRDLARFALSICGLLAGMLFFIPFRFPDHIAIPLLVYVLGALCLLTAGPNGGKNILAAPRLHFSTFVILLFFFLSLWQCVEQGRKILREADHSRNEHAYISACLTQVATSRPTPPLLVLMNPALGGGLRSEDAAPLREGSPTPSLTVFPSGWEINSPRYFSALQLLGLKDGRQFLEWLANKENVFLVMFQQYPEAGRIVEEDWLSYYRSRIFPKDKVRLKIMYDFRGHKGYGLVFYRIETV